MVNLIFFFKHSRVLIKSMSFIFNELIKTGTLASYEILDCSENYKMYGNADKCIQYLMMVYFAGGPYMV